MDSTFTLGLSLVILSLTNAALGATLPLLWWRVFKLEAKVEALDEVLVELLEAAGFKAGVQSPPPSNNSPSLPPVVKKGTG